ncbi:MAG: hypothetical protein EB079_01055 [Verrucomicrobia bacterium]|nr:hypothetical protein [Verrucomicrobiota bacterium]
MLFISKNIYRVEILFDKVLKRKIKSLIIELCCGQNDELLIDFPLSIGVYQTIEIDDDLGDIILHLFDSDFDYPFLFDDLSSDDKLRVYQILKGI